MLTVYETPIFTKQYTDPITGKWKEFIFRTVGVKNNVAVTFQSMQFPISEIKSQGGTYIQTSAPGNLTAQLEQVRNEVGVDNFNMYLFDPTTEGYNYSGLYSVLNITYASGKTTVVLKNIGNDASSYFGDKYFAESDRAQCVYKYLNNISYEIYDNTLVNESRVGKLLQTVVQPQEANGLSILNISEIIRSEVLPSGCKSIYINATETDYFGNTSTVISRTINFVDGYITGANYLYNVMYNPFTGGTLLESTSPVIYYNQRKVYPFYVNFIIQDLGYDSSSIQGILNITFYDKDGDLYNSMDIAVGIVEGLNSIDLSQFSTIKDVISNIYPTYIEVKVSYLLLSQFEFNSTQFTSEFKTTVAETPLVGSPYRINCELRTLNNRADFYLRYNNSVGGYSTLLSQMYDISTQNEIVSLRNRYDISNVIARQTETAKLYWKMLDLNTLNMLFGYDIDNMFKDNGIYESKEVLRIGSGGEQKTYIIKGADYGYANGDIYNDVSLDLYRPLNSGFENPAGVDISLTVREDKLVNITTLSAVSSEKVTIPAGGVNQSISILDTAWTGQADQVTVFVGDYLPTPYFPEYSIRIYWFRDSAGIRYETYTLKTKKADWLTKELNAPSNANRLVIYLYTGIAGSAQDKMAQVSNIAVYFAAPFWPYWHPIPSWIDANNQDTIGVQMDYKINTENTIYNSYGVEYRNGQLIESLEMNNSETSSIFSVKIPKDGSIGLLKGFVNTNFGKIEGLTQRIQYK